jgi:hypothetical protein
MKSKLKDFLPPSPKVLFAKVSAEAIKNGFLQNESGIPPIIGTFIQKLTRVYDHKDAIHLDFPSARKDLDQPEVQHLCTYSLGISVAGLKRFLESIPCVLKLRPMTKTFMKKTVAEINQMYIESDYTFDPATVFNNRDLSKIVTEYTNNLPTDVNSLVNYSYRMQESLIAVKPRTSKMTDDDPMEFFNWVWKIMDALRAREPKDRHNNGAADGSKKRIASKPTKNAKCCEGCLSSLILLVKL